MNDCIIIGAGPAGLSAAIACREWDLSVTVLDEFPVAGGRLLGQLYEQADGSWWNGIEETKKLLTKAEELDANIMCEVSVHHIEKADNGFIIHTNKGNFSGKTVLIASGAAEVQAPIPGWTLPGVMSIGAAQVMTNVHRVKVGEKGVIVGVNVLSAAIAHELHLAGVKVHSMALPAMNVISEDEANPKKVMESLARIAHLAPSAFIRFGSKFTGLSLVRDLVVKFFPSGGIKMWGMPIHLRRAVTEINGKDKVESVTISKITADGKIIPNTEETIDVDFVCIAGGLYPLAELAAVVGCPFKYVEELGGHVPLHNEAMETPVEGVYVAGNITGIESAQVAAAQGTVAGLSIAKRLLNDEEIARILPSTIADVKATRAEAAIQFHPGIDEGRKIIEQSFNEYA